MAFPIDHRAFFLSVRAPQHKHNTLAMLVDKGNHLISKRFPAKTGVGMGLTGAYGEHRIQQHDALARPAFEITVAGADKTRNRPFQLFIHVHQGRRRLNTRANRESQTVRLIRPMIGVLAQDHNFDVAQFGKPESVKHIFSGRINRDAICPLFLNGF